MDDDDDEVIVKTVVALLARELPERDVSHPWKEFLSTFSSFHLSLGGFIDILFLFGGICAATWQVCLLHVDAFGRVVTDALEKRVCVGASDDDNCNDDDDDDWYAGVDDADDAVF